MKYVPENDSPKLNRKRFSSDIEVKPFKLTAQRENCVTKVLFLGDQHYGGQNGDLMEEDPIPAFSVPYLERASTPAAVEKATTFIDQINSFASPYLQPRLWAAGSPTPTDSPAGRRSSRSSEQDDGLPWRQRFQRKLQSDQSREASPQLRETKELTKTRLVEQGTSCKSEGVPMRGAPRKSSGIPPKPDNTRVKASSKIIDIIAEKIREDRDAETASVDRKKSAGENGAPELQAVNSPPRPRRKISEYVFEKLKQERLSASRCNTPLAAAKS
jgi:hypothetical protein